MSTSSVGGSGSIIDVQGVVNQLMQIEARPLTIAKQRVSSVDTSISAMSQVKSLVDAAASSAAALEDSLTLTGRSVSNSDSGLLKATVANSSLASPGAYTVSNTQLARSQRTAFAGFATSSATFGSGFGTLTIDSVSTEYGALDPISGKSIEKSIVLAGKSLESIRDEINASPQLTGKITASIVNTGDASLGYVLVLNGAKSGSTAAFTATWDDAQDTDGDGADDDILDYGGSLVPGRMSAFNNPTDGSGIALNQSADDAQARVNGILLKSKSNVFSQAIPGLSFEILKTDPSIPGATATTATVTVRDNRETVKERIRKFAEDMTALNQRLVAMTKPGSKDTKAGPLAGNSGILSLSSSVSSAYSSGFKITSTNTVYSWSQLGLEWNRNGSVTVREGDLSTAMDGDIGTAMLGGFTSTIKATLAQFRGVSGSLQSSIDVLQTNRSRLSTNIDDLQSRLEKTRAKLISKYASLDAKLVSMNQMSANVRSSLAGLQ